MLSQAMLLAVDLGLRTGFAAYGENGRLTAYRSQNYGSGERLKRGAEAERRGHPGLRWLVGRERCAVLAKIWGRTATRLGAQQFTVTPEQWALEVGLLPALPRALRPQQR